MAATQIWRWWPRYEDGDPDMKVVTQILRQWPIYEVGDADIQSSYSETVRCQWCKNLFGPAKGYLQIMFKTLKNSTLSGKFQKLNVKTWYEDGDPNTEKLNLYDCR